MRPPARLAWSVALVLAHTASGCHPDAVPDAAPPTTVHPAFACGDAGSPACLSRAAGCTAAMCCDVSCGPDHADNPLCCDARAACFRDPADLTALDCCPMGDRLCPLPGAAGAVPTANCCAMATVCTSSGDCVPPDRACPTSGGPVVACPVGTTCDVATGACCPAGATLCETAAGGAGAGACCAAGETCNPATGACCALGADASADGGC